MNALKKSPKNCQCSEKSDLSDSGLPWMSNKSDSNLSSSADGLDVSSTSGSKNDDLPDPRPPMPPRRRKAKCSDFKMQVNRVAARSQAANSQEKEDVGESSSSSDGDVATQYSNRGYVIPKKCVQVKQEVDYSDLYQNLFYHPNERNCTEKSYK
eukprot:5529445-Ditylum_brightwellii.AAC.1